MRGLVGLLVLLALVYAVAAVGGWFTASSVGTWYQGLQKPSWTPPAWVFGPAWTLLYTLMAVAAWLVWRRGGTVSVRLPLVLFGVQLALNLAWSAIFFGARQPGWAVVELALLWCAVAATAAAFRRVSVVAAALLLPYLLWLSFAGALNLAVWRLN